MYFADLTLLMYHSDPWNAECWRVPLLAVGWLEKEHPLTRGDSPPELLLVLRQQVEGARQAQSHINFRGLHICTLCDQAESHIENSHINLLIPGAGKVYAAPAGIVHHIESHNYQPPIEFTEAVLRCHKYGSPEFFEALRAANLGNSIPLQHSEEEAKEWRKIQKARVQSA